MEETGDDFDSDTAAIMRRLLSTSNVEDVSFSEDERSGVDMMEIDGEDESAKQIAPAVRAKSRSSSLVLAKAPAPLSSKTTTVADKGKTKSKNTGEALNKKLKKESPLSLSALPPTALTTPPPKHPVYKETYIPPPKVPLPRVLSPSLQSSGRGTTASTASSKPNGNAASSQASESQGPKTHPALSQQQHQKSSSKHSRTGTQTSSNPSVTRSSTSETPSRSTGFIPAASSRKGRRSTPQPKSSTPVPVPEIPAPTSGTKKVKTPQKATLKQEQDWEVKAILGDRRGYDATNRLVHEYKVLWAGDWPPDQNPTWEPESNIPSSLIKKYSLQASARGKKQQTLLSYMPKRRFSNVAEAFAGELDEIEGQDQSQVGLHYEGEDGDDNQDIVDEPLVVTDDKEFLSSANGRKPTTPGFNRFDRSLVMCPPSFDRKRSRNPDT